MSQAGETEALIRAYYDAFNAFDVERFLSLLTDGVVHDVSQGGREVGKAAFRRFLARMDRCYGEKARDVAILVSADGKRAAAEFVIDGVYRATDEGLPPASGQRYVLPVGAFFEIEGGKIARISNHNNLKDWLRQIGG